MFRRDYIQRMIEEFGRVLSHAMALKTMDRVEEGLEELQEAYKTYFGISVEELEKIQSGDFVKTITGKHDFKKEQIEALARALMMEGELHSLNPVKSFDCRAKSLSLFRHLEIIDTETFSIARKDAIRQLESLLTPDI
jgi:hypothetical protein